MLTIANTGKFLGEFLAAIYILVKSEIHKIKCRQSWRRHTAANTAESFSSRDQLMSECESQATTGTPNPNTEPNKADIDTLGESDQKTVTLQLMLGAFFTYMVLGAALMPQFASSDFLSSMFLCFVSITTGDKLIFLCRIQAKLIWLKYVLFIILNCQDNHHQTHSAMRA